jgi:rRNA maturation endonuclease Nob1
MIYSCKKCLKTFEKEIQKCPSCGGKVKLTLYEEYKKEKKIDYECPYCKHNFPYNFRICPKCGKRSNRCPDCGFIFDKKLWVCPGCGRKIK